MAALSEQTGVHPQNINFGTTYVNVTLEGAEGKDPGEEVYALAARINTLNPAGG
jgi:4a-hydroxytetrahydrobiopterin dehydratase